MANQLRYHESNLYAQLCVLDGLSHIGNSQIYSTAMNGGKALYIEMSAV